VLQQNSTLNLQLTHKDLEQQLGGQFIGVDNRTVFKNIAYDTRNIVDGENTLFFALTGEFRDGHSFIQNAYDKGVRCFVISKKIDTDNFQDAAFYKVKDTLFALQELAAHHRKKFNYPLIAITGSAGKTTVKEWIYHLISPELKVIRSPKSFNSQLGVALSLLELTENCDIALIEVGISKVGEMERLLQIVQPTLGVFTSFGRAHEESFISSEQHLNEKLQLFTSVKKTFYPSTIALSSSQQKEIKGNQLSANAFQKELKLLPFNDQASLNNGLIALGVAHFLLGDKANFDLKISSLPRLAMRLESFEGINGNTIINDTYNLDLDALVHSLEYQLRLAGNRKRVVVIGLDKENSSKKSQIEEIVAPFKPDQLLFVDPPALLEEQFTDAVVLIKGSRKADMQRYARSFRLKNHTTYVEVNLSAVRHNLAVLKSGLLPSTKMLAMVKAQSYGSGLEKMGAYLENQGIDYLGVAYADEGVELRKHGIQLPILVMNTEEDGFEDCILNNLEPAIFTLKQLDNFIKELILHGKTHYPIHLKLDTGMKRLGFEMTDIPKVCDMLQAQPEVYVKSVYSHLADSDNRRDKRFTEHQIAHFKNAVSYIENRLNYHFLSHLLNSEGISNYPDAQFDMVRVGIGMYGLSTNPVIKRKLVPVVSWYSAISQIKTIKKGESVGYSRTFIAKEEMKIAIIPVGYADGFRRSLSNGKGSVYINGKACTTVGRVCMDMIMVDVTKLKANEGDLVEIIGPHQTIEKFAEANDTIPYEVLTSISKRVHRVYLEE
jgi:alanine racemase